MESGKSKGALEAPALVMGRANDQIITEAQLAHRHQRSIKTIRNLRVKGGYVPFLKIGRHVRYRLADVLEYEEKCLRQSTSDIGGDNADR